MVGQHLVGRDQERRLTGSVLADGGVVVLGGHAGVGKTALARDLARWWTDEGRPVEWLTATAPSAKVPFGAAVRLLGPVGEMQPEGVGDRTVDLIHGAVGAALACPGRLVVVDDGHHLDPASALLVQHLALSVGSVLVTVRNGEWVDPALSALWEGEHTTRLDLVGLSEAEVGVVAERLLGAPIDDSSVTALFEASQGNPLLLREVARDAVDAGGLQLLTDRWRWDGTVGRARRLRDAIGASLAAAGPRARHLVLLLALAQPLRLSVLRSIVGVEALDDAEDRGLVEVRTTDTGPMVELGHPMLGEVLLDTIEASELDQTRSGLIDALETSSDRTSLEMLVEARLRVDCGRVDSTDALLDAAAVAVRLGSAELGAELAGLARAQGAGPRAGMLLAEAHLLGGRLPEAVADFESVLPELDTDESRVRVAFHLHHSYVNLGDHASAAGLYARVTPLIADPVWAAVIGGHALQHEYMRGRTRDALERAEAILAEHDDPRVLVRLVSSIASGRALSGATESATEFVAEVFPHAIAVADVLPLAPAWAVNAQALSLLVAGRIDDARSMIDLVESVVHERPATVSPRLFLQLYRGRIELAAGHPRDALVHLVEVADAMAELDLSGQHRWVRSLCAEALALLGDIEGARRERALALATERHTEVYEGDAARARAWVTAAEGSLGAAIDELLVVADLQELEGQHGLAVPTIDDALRLGAGPEVLDRLARLLPTIDGSWAHALDLHVTARRSGDGVDLLRAEEAFTAMGADLHAAEAAAAAARAFERAGLRVRTSEAARRRDEALARTGPVSTPALRDGPARAVLTRREQEVATLAAQGLSNREIADQLFISLRTAEGHLLRASNKLGVSARTDLAAALEISVVTAPSAPNA